MSKGKTYRPEEINDRGVLNLACGVLELASHEYIYNAIKLKKCHETPKDQWNRTRWIYYMRANKLFNEAKCFFESDYCQMFLPSGLDGYSIIRRLDKEVNERYAAILERNKKKGKKSMFN